MAWGQCTSPDAGGSQNEYLAAMKRAMSEGMKLRAKYDMAEAEANMDFLANRCKHCGHTPRVKGGTIFVCRHFMEKLRKHSELVAVDACSDVGVSGFGFAEFAGLAVVIEDPEVSRTARLEEIQQQQEEHMRNVAEKDAAKQLERKRLRGWKVGVEFKPQDLWVGVYWSRTGHLVDVWICLVPMVPIHIAWWTTRNPEE